jgi:oxygen-independent coproporphyrinogen-3 oxidase
MPKKLPWLTIITNTCRQAQQSVYKNASLTTPPTFHQYYPPPTSACFHLPFRRKRCHYCDFPLGALGSTNPTETDLRISNYIELLQREIGSTRSSFDTSPPLETVFFWWWDSSGVSKDGFIDFGYVKTEVWGL